MIICNFRKIMMIFLDLGLQCVPQVFNIFEKRILGAQRTFGRSTIKSFLGRLQRSRRQKSILGEKMRRSCLQNFL